MPLILNTMEVRTAENENVDDNCANSVVMPSNRKAKSDEGGSALKDLLSVGAMNFDVVIAGSVAEGNTKRKAESDPKLAMVPDHFLGSKEAASLYLQGLAKKRCTASGSWAETVGFRMRIDDAEDELMSNESTASCDGFAEVDRAQPPSSI